jgi:pimeloyl-ACP methyl ester carboxylesterase
MILSLELEGEQIQLHYVWHGTGDKVLLTFHGFGQSGSAMFPLDHPLGSAYRICHIDAFYHGESYWKEELGPLSKKHWRMIMEAFLVRENISRFDMAAFSMGGKFLMATMEAFPNQVDHLMLIAPDGIKTNTWYSLASYPILFRSYFRSMIVKPWRFYNLINILKKLGVLDKGIAKFASTQMDTRRKRRRVYYAWVMFRHLTFNKRKLAKLINQHDVRVDFYIGRYDKIITEEGMSILSKHLHCINIHVLESGHNQLIKETAKSME